MAPVSDDNLAARVAELEDVVARLRAEMSRKDGALIWQKDRIAELEKALEEAGRRQKRQTAPFFGGGPEVRAEASGSEGW